MSSRTRAVSESISLAISTAVFDVDGVGGRPRLAGENPALATLSALNLSFWSTIGKPTARVGLARCHRAVPRTTESIMIRLPLVPAEHTSQIESGEHLSGLHF
jgi:hypothetical protein